MGNMASLFFNKAGRIAFYLCLTIYLYGDLAIYGAAVAKSLRDVACTYTPANLTRSSNNISEDSPCWDEDSNLNRMDAYRIALAIFVCAVGPFAFFNVTKTKYLQLLTTLMRWLAFGIMVTLACIRLSRGHIYRPAMSQFSGVPNLFGVCVYSFMCHHSLPSLGKSVSCCACAYVYKYSSFYLHCQLCAFTFVYNESAVASARFL
jgi:branched-subunit amino acid transport protein AzlD